MVLAMYSDACRGYPGQLSKPILGWQLQHSRCFLFYCSMIPLAVMGRRGSQCWTDSCNILSAFCKAFQWTHSLSSDPVTAVTLQLGLAIRMKWLPMQPSGTAKSHTMFTAKLDESSDLRHGGFCYEIARHTLIWEPQFAMLFWTLLSIFWGLGCVFGALGCIFVGFGRVFEFGGVYFKVWGVYLEVWAPGAKSLAQYTFCSSCGAHTSKRSVCINKPCSLPTTSMLVSRARLKLAYIPPRPSCWELLGRLDGFPFLISLPNVQRMRNSKVLFSLFLL